MLPSAVDWTSCPAGPTAWFSLRDSLLQLITTPALLLPLVASLVLVLCATARLGWAWRALLPGLAVLLASLLYSPLTTAGLSDWLDSQMPPPHRPYPGPALAVLVGRGPDIAAATTAQAARLLRQGQVQQIYVSGDTPATAQRLLELGVPPGRIFGGQLRQNHLGERQPHRRLDPPAHHGLLPAGNRADHRSLAAAAGQPRL
jgi:uncharacterized SAM-binding protein YcdF (DUF218 family)